MDPCCLLFILLLIKLSGTHDVIKIPVQRGQSILIPCLYKREYVYSNDFLRCYRVLSHHSKLSHQRYNPPKVFFSDDKTHKICSVNNVQEFGDYWCGVLPPCSPNKQTTFVMEVTTGPSGLYVSNQYLTGFENDSVTVTCYHHGKHYVKWCKFGGHCMSGTSGTLDGASVEIRYSQAFMTVTMNKLKMENTGWYSCSSKDLQMPYITVKQKMSLTSTELPQITPETTARKRTAVLFLLPVILEVLLVIFIYASWRLFKLCRKRSLISRKQEAEDAYVTMHKKQSSHQTGCADVSEGTYERMAGLKSDIEMEPDYVNVTKT